MLRRCREGTEIFCSIAALTVSLSPGLQGYAAGFQMHLYNKHMKTVARSNTVKNTIFIFRSSITAIRALDDLYHFQNLKAISFPHSQKS